MVCDAVVLFFFFNDTATTEIYTLSLHDALPIFERVRADQVADRGGVGRRAFRKPAGVRQEMRTRSEEHTSELQSRSDLVCRLLLVKKKQYSDDPTPNVQPDNALFAGPK